MSKRVVRRKKDMTEGGAVQEYLLDNPQEAFDGTMRCSDVFQYVTKRMYSTPFVAFIHAAIGLFGPVGEGDIGWLNAATRGELPRPVSTGE